MKTSLWRIICAGTVLAALILSICFVSGCSRTKTSVTRAGSLSQSDKSAHAYGVCPPFKLRDERGNIINPVQGINDSAPYSPKQTCGGTDCHDYDKITEGYHFTQGKGEELPTDLKERYRWVSFPGNYGGNWCSPAPLYRSLAAKKNTNPRMIDMTSFEFITAGCGGCHPGGGPVEYDRDGNRYDEHMRNPASGFTSGGDNDLDGDYYKARWSESGVIEADCLLCHMPQYDYKKRNKHLSEMNFRWAATEGAKFGTISGSIKEGTPVTVAYDTKLFDEDGNVSMQIVRQPRNATCLNCHAKPGWKKRGASFGVRTDVHMKAGMRCVDCHAAGSHAADERIRGREIHQIGKGDDPSGHVRNDLDNTIRDCADCHIKGYLNAPIANHQGIPPLHLDKLSCQACHIPERTVKSAQVQVSDVYNPAPKITPPSKRAWTFYDANMSFWNHYGELDMFTHSDQPTDPYRPVLARYKGKIYPVNRVHSAWPAIIEEGKEGLNQAFIKDIYSMWKTHKENPQMYPELAKIVDDNGDGMPEVNRSEEIDAFIDSVTAYLKDTGFDLTGKKVAWASDDRLFTSGTEWTPLAMHVYEASPYASTYKYSHDVAPARAALGANGCTDCHNKGAGFFNAQVVKYPFGEDGNPVVISQADLLGISGTAVALASWRESWLKPASVWIFGAVLLLALLHYVVFGAKRVPVSPNDQEVVRYSLKERLAHFLVVAGFAVLAVTSFCFLLGSGNPLGPGSRAVHAAFGVVFTIGSVALLAAWIKVALPSHHDKLWLTRLGGYFGYRGKLTAGKFNAGQKLFFWFAALCGLGLAATGIMMMLRNNFPALMPVVYTLHDFLAVLLLSGWLAHIYLAIIANPGTLRAIFEGKVSRAWAEHHHPQWESEEGSESKL